MTRYDIWTEHINHAKYIVDANNEGEAIGRARERYHLSDKLVLYAIPYDENGYPPQVTALAGNIHATALNVYKAWQYARRQNYHMAAVRFEAMFASLNRQYTACISLADILDSDNRSLAKKRLDDQTSRQNPGNIVDAG